MEADISPGKAQVVASSVEVGRALSRLLPGLPTCYKQVGVNLGADARCGKARGYGKGSKRRERLRKLQHRLGKLAGLRKQGYRQCHRVFVSGVVPQVMCGASQ